MWRNNRNNITNNRPNRFVIWSFIFVDISMFLIKIGIKASKDKGFHKVDCTTDLTSLEPKEIAKLVMNVNDNATNSFIQQIRRRLSILERPLMTARGDGKSYIYANFNPKYAQYALTILRTFYNFCEIYKSADGKVLTPAQRLGITDKVFDLKDIIYLR